MLAALQRDKARPMSIETPLIDPRPLMGGFAPDLYYPHYRAVSSGPWTLSVVPMAAARGYWGDVHRLDGSVILKGPCVEGTQSWMSLLPSEMESQEIGLRAAYGHTVVFGMGMGWLTANLALRAEVDRVTVVERDADILQIIEACEVLQHLPPESQSKIHIVQADALEWVPDRPVDSLQADIWRRIYEPQKLDDVRRMQANVQAKSIYYWGQEMDIWKLAMGHSALDWPSIRHIVTDRIALPLILPDWPDYPEKINQAAQWWYPQNHG